MDPLGGSVAFLEKYGYLTKRQAAKVDSFENATFMKAVQKYQENEALVERLQLLGGQELLCDGRLGSATYRAMEMPRCGEKDLQGSLAIAPGMDAEALGTGGWRGCIPEYPDDHGAICMITRQGMTDKWSANDRAVYTITQNAYCEIGLLWIFVDENRRDILTGEDRSNLTVNTTLQWKYGNGWIGLATVGGRQSCGSHLPTLYLDPRYGRTFDVQTFIHQQAALLMHELGHNASLQHVRGSVMNPGILDYSRRPPSWVGDPHESNLRRIYGGVRITPPTGEPPEPPQPPDDGTVPPIYGALSEPVLMHGYAEPIYGQLLRVK